jgi:DNA-binding IclR family transcriptional regulator
MASDRASANAEERRPTRSAGTLHSTSKLMAILRLFTATQSEWTVEDGADALGMPASTAYRYFRELNEAGLIGSSAAGRYILGPAIMELDRQTRLQDPLIRAARPLMVELKERMGQDCVILLCRLYRQQVMCVHQEQVGNPAVGVSFERGLPLPLHRGAASKAILASMPARLAKAYQLVHALDMAAVGLGRNWVELKAQLRALRTARVCITRSEVDTGAVGFGAPVLGAEGEVVGSLGLVLPEASCTPELEADLAQQVRGTAQEITRALRNARGT